MLLSDMCAFKAANPGCCLVDFVRWHSPRDWLPTGEGAEGGGRERGAAGRLSERMTSPGNMWGRLWAQVGARGGGVVASEGHR